MPREGRYHSLDFPFQMYHGSTGQDTIYLLLSHSFTYYFLLHDPHFFFGLYNPSYPMARLAAVNPNLTKNFYHYLIMTEVEELDLHEDPCNPDPDYSHQTCLKQSLSSQVGCRTRWDRWSRQDLPLCATIDQFRYILVDTPGLPGLILKQCWQWVLNWGRIILQRPSRASLPKSKAGNWFSLRM